MLALTSNNFRNQRAFRRLSFVVGVHSTGAYSAPSCRTAIRHQHCADHGKRAKGPRKNRSGIFSNVEDFIRSGGMGQIEYVAADEAKRYEREYWLPILEKWLTKWEAEHVNGEMVGDLYGWRLRGEIKRFGR